MTISGAPGERPIVACRICGCSGAHPRFQAREMHFGMGDVFDYFQCTRCGCLQISEVPADLAHYYPSDYYSLSGPELAAGTGPVAGLKRYLKRKLFAQALFGRGGRLGRFLHGRYGHLCPENYFVHIRKAGATPESRILDVGCGRSSLLYVLREAGVRQLLGVDPYLEQDFDHPNGVRVLKGTLQEVEGHWDLIMMHHAFEHVIDQHGTLRALGERLAPGGVGLVRIPLASSYAWEHYGTDWVGLDAPRHLFLHTVDSFRLLAGEVGLCLMDVVFDSSSFQFLGSEQYRRGIPLRSPRSHVVDPSASIFSAQDLTGFRARAEALNRDGRGDQAAFYLSRSGDSVR